MDLKQQSLFSYTRTAAFLCFIDGFSSLGNGSDEKMLVVPAIKTHKSLEVF
jgi:hypothetical protein